jgi:FMN reductase
MKAVVVVGNPKLKSRTRDAAERLAAGLGAECTVIEVAELGPGLLGWGDETVAAAVRTVQGADVVIAASPTFKATYTGLLKLFLDQFAGATGMAGVVGIPLMLGAGPSHALAPELLLKPVLVELGAICPTQGLYQIDRTYDTDESLQTWLTQWGPVITRLT